MKYYMEIDENSLSTIFEFIDHLKEIALNKKSENALKLLNKEEESLKKIYITK